MDASYKIQRGIHVHLIQFFMCPEFWVHINAHSAEIHRGAPGEFQHHVHRLQAAWIRPRMGEAYKLLLHADLSHTVAELAQHHLQAVLGNFHAHWPELFPNERKKLAPADTPRPAQDLQNVLLLNR